MISSHLASPSTIDVSFLMPGMLVDPAGENWRFFIFSTNHSRGTPAPCNTFKGDRTPAEAGMKLLKVPRKPGYLPSITVKMDSRNLPAEWAPYWTTSLES